MLLRVSRLPLTSNQTKQQSTTLHIGTHILSESSKDNAQTPYQTHYQLNSHLQSNTLELDVKRIIPHINIQIQASNPSLDLSTNQTKQQSTTIVVWVDGEGLLPITTVCLM
jgi:hypothetical protein